MKAQFTPSYLIVIFNHMNAELSNPSRITLDNIPHAALLDRGQTGRDVKYPSVNKQ
jgi:hypothetical protein